METSQKLNKSFPFSSLPLNWPSSLPQWGKAGSFPCGFSLWRHDGAGRSMGKTPCENTPLCTFPIFAIRRAIRGPGCYPNKAALPKHWVPSTEQVSSLNWRWWAAAAAAAAAARLCSWPLWCLCCSSTSAASQKVSVTLSASTGARTIFTFL